jgi:uncharacterized repeat protein (TIGR01451 family)
MFDNALSFDGTNDYVDCGSNVGSFDLSDPFTIEAWINPALDYTNDVIYGNAWAEQGYHVRVTLDNKVRFILIQTGSIYKGIDSSVLTAEWHHIAAVWDGTDVKIYVDGVDDSKTAIENGTVTTITTAANTKIGLDTAASANYFNGIIDEVRIWKTALTQSQLDDMTAPTITITTPANGATYLLNQTVNADWSVSDGTGTGVAIESGTVPSGSPINTAAAGMHTFTVTVTDYAKNTDTKTVTYNVISPSIEIVKTADAKAAAPGETVTYTYTVTNDGDVPLSDVTVSDDPAGDAEYVSGDTNGDIFLDLDETWIFTIIDYIIPVEDAPEDLCNTAIVKGWYGEGEDEWVSDTSNEICIHTMGARTIGYWKNHLEDWCSLPSESIFYGVDTLTLLTYFPGSGAEANGMNPLEMLRAQLLAAELNVACFDEGFDYSRYEAADIYVVIVDSEVFLAPLPVDLNAYWFSLGKAGQSAFRKANADSLALKDVLDTFNNMGDEIFE